jgi:hypothetical protein
MNPYINKEKKIKKSYEIIPFSKSVFFFLHSSTITKKKKHGLISRMWPLQLAKTYDHDNFSISLNSCLKKTNSIIQNS